MSVPTDLDRRFREAAVRTGMLDAGYDIVDSPVGPLLVAATTRVCSASRSIRRSGGAARADRAGRRPARAAGSAAGRPCPA